MNFDGMPNFMVYLPNGQGAKVAMTSHELVEIISLASKYGETAYAEAVTKTLIEAEREYLAAQRIKYLYG